MAKRQFISRQIPVGLATLTLVSPAAASAADAKAGLQAMRELNLIVLGDMKGGHDVEGKTYVGGNLSGNSMTVGIGNSKQGAADSTRATLTVGGNLTANNVNVNNGLNGGANTAVSGNPGVYVVGDAKSFNLNAKNANVQVGGKLDTLKGSEGGSVAVGGDVGRLEAGKNSTVQVGGKVDFLKGADGSQTSIRGDLGGTDLGKFSTVLVGGSASNINGAAGAVMQIGGGWSGYKNNNGATISSGQTLNISAPTIYPLADYTAALAADLNALSSSLSALTIENNPSTYTRLNNKVTFNAVDNGLGYAVFNVDTSIFNADQFIYNFGSTTLPVIINVLGSGSLTWLANTKDSNALANQQLIWNFANFDFIDFQRKVNGSVLAPLAHIKNNTPIEGSVVAKSFEQGGEIHLGTYAGGDSFLSAVPEPATWSMMILGFFGLGAVLRRRKDNLALA